MNHPELLFVHRLGAHDGMFHGRCICCDPGRPEQWLRGQQWHGFILDLGMPVVFRQAVTDWSGEVWEPAEVYADEPCLRDLPPNDCIALMNAQNYTHLVFDKFPSGLVPPFFISTVNPSTPVSLRVHVSFVNNNVHTFPEVEDYKQKMRSNVRDRWDAMLVPKDTDEPLLIPLDYWLPMSLGCGQREAGGVYAVREWLNADDAVVDIVCADRSVPIGTGCVLYRRFQTSKGTMVVLQLGVVRRIVDHLTTDQLSTSSPRQTK